LLQQYLRETASDTVRTPAALTLGGGLEYQAACDTKPAG